MNITEKKLLDNYKYITNCGDLCSVIDGKLYYWGYGSGSGYNYKRVLYRSEADSIRIEEHGGLIYSIDLPERCMNKKKNELVQELIKNWNEEVIHS